MKGLLSMKKICLVFLTSLFVWATGLTASEEIDKESELYQKGLAFRNEGLQIEKTGENTYASKSFLEAMDCFLPLAKSRHAKAAHNYAFCCYKTGEVYKAYFWYKMAAEWGLEVSENNMKIIEKELLSNPSIAAFTKQAPSALNNQKTQADDIFPILSLPNELLVKIASNLKMKNFCNFKLVCKKFYKISQARSLKNGYDPVEIFKNAEFSSNPTSITIENSLSAKNTEIHIRFRDAEHLKEIAHHIPLIKISDGDFYFFKNENIKNGEEFLATNGNDSIKFGHFIHMKSNKPIEISGEFKLPCPTIFPKNCLIAADFSTSKGASVSHGNSPIFFEYAMILYESLKSSSAESRQKKTQLAQKLLKDRQEKRKNSPNEFRTFKELCPNGVIVNDEHPVQILPFDCLDCAKPVIFKANSKNKVLEFIKLLPVSNNKCVKFIDAAVDEMTIDYQEDINVCKGWRITSNGSLFFLGVFPLINYNLEILPKKDLYNIANFNGYNILLGANVLYCGSFDNFQEKLMEGKYNISKEFLNKIYEACRNYN